MSTSVIRDVLVKISTDNSGLEKGLDAAKSTLRGFATAAGAALGAATVAFAGVTAAAIRSAKEIDRFSKVSNSSTQEFQRWTAAAKTAGIQSEKVADILKDVNDRVGDFITTGGGPMADFFEKIAPKVGITADAFRDLSGPEALQLYVDTLEKAGASQQELTFHMEAMASDATLLLPLLRNNGEELNRLADAAQRAGAILSDDTLASLNEAKTSIDQIQNSFSGFTNLLIASVAPALATAASAFAEMSGQGGPIAEAVDRIASAFSNMATLMASPEFIGAATTVLTSIINLTSLSAEGFIWLTENIELTATAVGALSVAVALLGGPLSVAVKLAALAAGAYLLMGDNSDKAKDGAYNVAEAEAALNAELNVFSQSASPAARNESRQRVISLKEQAAAALAAAEAELALASAMAETAAAKSDLSGQDLLSASAGGGAGMGDFLDGVLPDEKVAEVSNRIDKIKANIAEMTSALKDMDASGGAGGSVQVAPLPEIPGFEPFVRPDDKGTGGSGGSGSGEGLEARLQSLQEELATEKEILDAWYVERQETLDEALANRQITEEEYRQQRERLEQEHADRMASIDQTSMDTRLGVMKHVFGGLEDLMDSGNKKLFNIGKAASLANAAIDGYEAAISSYKHGAKIGGPALGAVYAGISLARTAAMMAKISSQSYGGKSSGGGSAGSSTISTSSSEREAPLQVNLNSFGAGDFVRAADFGLILDRINEVAGDRGYNLLWRES